MQLSQLLFGLVVVTASVAATAQNKTAGIAPKAGGGFCSFLPRHPGYARVADGEPAGISFCTAKTLTLGNTTASESFTAAETFPSGFIQSAHYKITTNYSQVTGCFDRTRYDLNKNDGGGQFDIVSSNGPPACLGFKYFVNLVEPDAQQYCIRCCHNVADCNRGISEYGCARVVANGDYTNSAGTKQCSDITYADNTSKFSTYTNTISGESLTSTKKSTTKVTTTATTTTITPSTTNGISVGPISLAKSTTSKSKAATTAASAAVTS